MLGKMVQKIEILEHQNKILIVVWVLMERQTASFPLIRFQDSSYWDAGDRTTDNLLFNDLLYAQRSSTHFSIRHHLSGDGR